MPNQPSGPHNGGSNDYWKQHSIAPKDNSRVTQAIGNSPSAQLDSAATNSSVADSYANRSTQGMNGGVDTNELDAAAAARATADRQKSDASKQTAKNNYGKRVANLK